VEPLHDRSVRVTGLVMTSYKNKSPLSSDLPRGSLENLYEKIRDLKAEFQQVEEKMRTAVESLPQAGGGGYYPGKFTEKMERRGLAGDTACSSGPLQNSQKYCSTGPLQNSQKYCSTGPLQHSQKYCSTGPLQNSQKYCSSGPLQNSQKYCSTGPLQNSQKYCSTGPLQNSQTVQIQEGRGTVLASWTPWPPWCIRWEKVRRRGDRKVEVQILSCEASVVEYQLS